MTDDSYFNQNELTGQWALFRLTFSILNTYIVGLQMTQCGKRSKTERERERERERESITWNANFLLFQSHTAISIASSQSVFVPCDRVKLQSAHLFCEQDHLCEFEELNPHNAFCAFCLPSPPPPPPPKKKKIAWVCSSPRKIKPTPRAKFVGWRRG